MPSLHTVLAFDQLLLDRSLNTNMRNVSITRAFILLNLGCSLLLGCASAPPKPQEAPKIKSGEQMLRESQGMAQLGERWLEGKKKVEQGEELVREGQAKIDEGQRMIEDGKKIMRESEEGYMGIKK